MSVSTPLVALESRFGGRVALLGLGGLAVAAPFLSPRLWPLAWLALIPLFALAPHAKNSRFALLEGWAMGLAVNVPAFYWLIETMHRFGGFPRPVAIAFYGVLSAYSALQFGVVAWLLRRAGPQAPVLFAPLAWTAVEFLFPNLFPWRLGHSQRDLPWLIQMGDLTGPYGLSFLMAWTSSAISRTPLALPRLVAPVLAVALAVVYGAWRLHAVEGASLAAPAFRVGIVQGNLSLDEKRHRHLFESNVERYRRLSASLVPTPDLLVWPETVVEWGIPRDEPLPANLDPYPRAPAPLLFGAVSYLRSGGSSAVWFNSAFLRRPEGETLGPYDKIVLMPFGEFIPFSRWFPSLKDLSPNSGDFEAGLGPVVLPVPPSRLGPLICYEDLLAGHVRSVVRAGATVLVTIANDAWFGTSSALEQHETLALWRAIENRRYLIRSTNTGLTSVIDPLGRRVASLPVATEGATAVTVRSMEMASPYTSLGDTFAWAVVAAAAGLLASRRRSDRLRGTQDVNAPSQSSSFTR